MAGSSIGIMDPAYFVGRKEILTWVNDTFSLNYTKIEDTASGAVACQIADAIYPGDVPMAKVKWDAKSDFEFIQNYKILQRVFDKRGVEKYIDVEKLVRAKYQDNLEFMQWIKSFFDKNFHGGEYDAVGRRAGGKGAPTATASAGAAIRKPAAPRAAVKAPGARVPVAAVEEPEAAPAAAVMPSNKPRAAAGGAAPGKKPTASAGGASTDALAKHAEGLTAEVADLRLSVEGLEKERDFYFGKLRDIEILMQAYQGPDADISKQIFTILYATEEDFVVADEVDGVVDKENRS